MRESSLELRSWPVVALAYAAAPLAGLTSLWLFVFFQPPPRAGSDWTAAFQAWGLFLMIGGWACLLVEGLVVTPFLLAFRKYRWWWLNGRSAAAIGFLLGALPFLIMGLLDAPADSLSLTVGGVPLIVDGHRTPAGWARIFMDSAKTGLVGFVAAVVFRLMAVRRRSAQSQRL